MLSRSRYGVLTRVERNAVGSDLVADMLPLTPREIVTVAVLVPQMFCTSYWNEKTKLVLPVTPTVRLKVTVPSAARVTRVLELSPDASVAPTGYMSSSEPTGQSEKQTRPLPPNLVMTAAGVPSSSAPEPLSERTLPVRNDVNSQPNDWQGSMTKLSCFGAGGGSVATTVMVTTP